MCFWTMVSAAAVQSRACSESKRLGWSPGWRFVQVRMLGELAEGLRRRRLRLAISNPSERVYAMFERSRLLDTIGEAPMLEDAVIANVQLLR